MNPKDMVFTEKYRPTKIDDIVGDFKDKIKKYLENPKSLPNFLLHSKKPGTGKTTLAKAIIKELGCDYIIINSSDDRKIETIRSKVKQFAMSKSSTPGVKRCVFLDEADGLLSPPQNALRNTMETYASNVFFILTCNNINKIIEPLISRCVVIPFAYPKKEEIYKYLEGICTKESLDYTEEGINQLIDLNYPSIRNCVLSLMDLQTQEKTVIVGNIKSANETFKILYDKIFKDKDWKYVKKIVMESTVDPRELNSFFWEKALEENNVKLIQRCCLNEKDIAWGADAKIIFVTSLLEMAK